jgi:DNA repair protein RecN (Recombination protein N)
MPLRRKVREAYTVFVPLKNRLNRLVTSQKRDTEQLELYTFQKKEIEDADIQESEDIALEDEKKRLEHSEQLFGLSQRGLNDLYEGDGSVYERLNSLAGDLDRAVAIDGDLESIAGELADAVYRVEDLAARFREYGAGITMDENRLEEIIERLDLLIKLKRKYS